MIRAGKACAVRPVARPVYYSDFGVCELPLDMPKFPSRRDGQPDRRHRLGKQVSAYFKHIEALAEQEYVAGRDLEIAPSFRAWAQAN